MRYRLQKSPEHFLKRSHVYTTPLFYLQEHGYIFLIKAFSKQCGQGIYSIIENKWNSQHPPVDSEKVLGDNLDEESQWHTNNNGLEQVFAQWLGSV